MRTTLAVIGILFCIMGGVWIFQGIGVLKGSFMTGQGFWIAMGIAAVAVGAGLLFLGRGRSSR